MSELKTTNQILAMNISGASCAVDELHNHIASLESANKILSDKLQKAEYGLHRIIALTHSWVIKIESGADVSAAVIPIRIKATDCLKELDDE